ncbi:g7448 [Coccomyxa viridis]|uniref:tRNA-specific adenosine deaminase 1 n=1 Tax=Coccomyxa viridis TaxID=1274662 RepID=A0ABP1FXV7_9CHLO
MSTASLPEAVAEVILRQYESLPKTGKPQPNEHTVLAGFAVSINNDFQDSVQGAATQPGHARLVPVALGTGTKCVGSRQSRDQIDVINDSHAETPARNNEEAGSTELKQIDARQPTAAAGSLRSQSHEEEEQRRNWEASQEEGVLRTKPGRGSPTQSLSCSDKLARWCILGVQGALLLQVLEVPLYMSSLTVACTAEPAKHSTKEAFSALERAVLGRTAGARDHLGVAKEDTIPKLYVLSQLPANLAEPFTPSAARNVSTGLSINWHAPPSGRWSLARGNRCQQGVAEATLAASGRKAGTAKTAASLQSHKTRSILCRAAFFDRYLSLKAHAQSGDRRMGPVLLPQSPEQQYTRAKTEQDYLSRWQALQATDSIFSVWYSARGLSCP